MLAVGDNEEFDKVVVGTVEGGGRFDRRYCLCKLVVGVGWLVRLRNLEKVSGW